MSTPCDYAWTALLSDPDKPQLALARAEHLRFQRDLLHLTNCLVRDLQDDLAAHYSPPPSWVVFPEHWPILTDSTDIYLVLQEPTQEPTMPPCLTWTPANEYGETTRPNDYLPLFAGIQPRRLFPGCIDPSTLMLLRHDLLQTLTYILYTAEGGSA